MRVPTVILILTLASPLGSVAAQSDPYVGTFSSDVLVLQLQAARGGYSGVAVLQGQRFPVTARQTMNGLEGSYSAQGTTYPWTAALQGDLLVMYCRWANTATPPAGCRSTATRPGNAAARSGPGRATATLPDGTGMARASGGQEGHADRELLEFGRYGRL